MMLKAKKSYFEEELVKNKNKSRVVQKVLNSFGLNSNKTDITKFYSELVEDLQEKPPKARNKFTS